MEQLFIVFVALTLLQSCKSNKEVYDVADAALFIPSN